MLVVDEQFAWSVLCSTMDKEAFYRPPWVNPVHPDQSRQTLDVDIGVERRHRFTGAPNYLGLGPRSGKESVGHHVLELFLAIVIEEVAHIAHLIQEDSEEFMIPPVTGTSFEQFGYKQIIHLRALTNNSLQTIQFFRVGFFRFRFPTPPP